MTPALRPDPLAPARRGTTAFTLVEVVLAGFVLVLGIASSLLVLQRGFQALDTARHLTAATQVMQSEMERLRLLDWSQLQALENSQGSSSPVDTGQSGDRFSCVRRIENYKPDMKQIVLTASWHGHDGRLHTVHLITRYCRDGLNDYYYTVH